MPPKQMQHEPMEKQWSVRFLNIKNVPLSEKLFLEGWEKVVQYYNNQAWMLPEFCPRSWKPAQFTIAFKNPEVETTIPFLFPLFAWDFLSDLPYDLSFSSMLLGQDMTEQNRSVGWRLYWHQHSCFHKTHFIFPANMTSTSREHQMGKKNIWWIVWDRR